MNKKTGIIGIISGIILIIIAICSGIFFTNNQEEIVPNSIEATENIYEIDIDDSKLNIFYFYVGQADSTLIMNNGEVMLIDGGDQKDGSKIVEFLKEIGITKIDYLIGTHCDDDHIGGLIDIVNNIEIGSFYMPEILESDNDSYLELISNISIESIEEGNIINFGNAECIVKWVDNTSEYTDNNSSIVLQINYGNKKYLFTGDIESKVEDVLIKKETIEEIDILKVAHHGSNTSSSEEFLKATNPKSVIISSGSTYTLFPNTECLKRIINILNINLDNIYITERDGTIWVSSDGMSDDIIQKLYDVNLDGNGSSIDKETLDNEYLESLREESKLSFFQKSIVFLLCA